MIQCKNGHFYDAQKNAECPYCREGSAVRPLGEANAHIAAPEFPKTAPMYQAGANVGTQSDIPKTTPLDSPEISKTIALNVNEQGYDPVRGWLVCIEGEKKGKDFRIHSEKNFIGRSKGSDICLDFDQAISRDNHAIITYDVKKIKFWVQTGDGRSNIYVNDDIVLNPVELQPYDVLQIGNSKLMFVPFCCDKFNWE